MTALTAAEQRALKFLGHQERRREVHTDDAIHRRILRERVELEKRIGEPRTFDGPISDSRQRLAELEQAVEAERATLHRLRAKQQLASFEITHGLERLTSEARAHSPECERALIAETLECENAAYQRFATHPVSTGIVSAAHGERFVDGHNRNRIDAYVERCRAARRAAESMQLEVIPLVEAGQRVEALRESIGKF
jgi:hypothetical protein